MRDSFKLPDTLVIMGSILLLMMLLTWIIPPGEFQRMEVDDRTLIEPGTYSAADFSGQSFTDLLLSPVKGFIEAAQIIAFVVIVGGAFQIIQRTLAIQASLQHMAAHARRFPARKKWIIPLLTFFFSLA